MPKITQEKIENPLNRVNVEVMDKVNLDGQSTSFAIEIINLVKELKKKREATIATQISHSGTSIGSNIREARYAQGNPDYLSKLQIALKETNKTEYWIEILYKTNYMNKKQYESLITTCKGIKNGLIACIENVK